MLKLNDSVIVTGLSYRGNRYNEAVGMVYDIAEEDASFPITVQFTNGALDSLRVNDVAIKG